MYGEFPISHCRRFSKDIFTNPNMALLKTIQTLYAGEISPLVR
jgi:hypothetical protein